VNKIARLVLMAYPKSFRREFGAEWSRTIEDMRVHGGHSRARIVGRVLSDAAVTASRMRWENLMGTFKTALVIIAAIVGAAALVFGSPAVAMLVVAVVVLLAVLASRHEPPIAAEFTAWSARWYYWIAAAAGLFAVGFGPLLTNEDNELSSVAWATWILSWLSGAVVATVGLALGATRLASRRRA
jgi:hypothetical protein